MFHWWALRWDDKTVLLRQYQICRVRVLYDKYLWLNETNQFMDLHNNRKEMLRRWRIICEINKPFGHLISFARPNLIKDSQLSVGFFLGWFDLCGICDWVLFGGVQWLLYDDNERRVPFRSRLGVFPKWSALGLLITNRRDHVPIKYLYPPVLEDNNDKTQMMTLDVDCCPIIFMYPLNSSTRGQ